MMSIIVQTATMFIDSGLDHALLLNNCEPNYILLNKKSYFSFSVSQLWLKVAKTYWQP